MSILIGAAILAASSHTTQPSIFRMRDSWMGVIADRTRVSPANDPDDREPAMGCACAVFDVIESRRTCRRALPARAIPAEGVAALIDAARREGAWLQCPDSAAHRQQAAELISEGDEMQWADTAWRRELGSWMHPRRHRDELVPPGLALPVAQAVVRTFDMRHGAAARDSQLADASPLLAVLGTASDDPAGRAAAGQALLRALLTACLHGRQAPFLNQPIRGALLRSRLPRRTGPAMPRLSGKRAATHTAPSAGNGDRAHGHTQMKQYDSQPAGGSRSTQACISSGR